MNTNKGTKHTPGPWHVQEYSKDKLFVNAEHAQVAHILYTETRGLLSMPEQRSANAALIAAAPLLLEACKQIVWKLSHNHDLPDYVGPARITRKDATVQMAIAAIKEAQP